MEDDAAQRVPLCRRMWLLSPKVESQTRPHTAQTDPCHLVGDLFRCWCLRKRLVKDSAPRLPEGDAPNRECPLLRSHKVGYRLQQQPNGLLTVPVAGGTRVHRRLPGWFWLGGVRWYLLTIASSAKRMNQMSESAVPLVLSRITVAVTLHQ